MTQATDSAGRSLRHSIARDGFAFVQSAAMQELLAEYGLTGDRSAFAASWDDLVVDTWMADGGRYRRRRHAVYSASADGSIGRMPHRAHYQGLEYNPLHGGIARWFEPIVPDIGSGAVMMAVLRLCNSLFASLASVAPRAWDIEVHQFRIEARAGEPGQPTPEGVHRDGVDYALAMMVRRHNIASGTTTIHSADGASLGSFTLTEPFDAALVDDARVYHGVTGVEALDPAQPAFRDVLVVTFRKI